MINYDKLSDDEIDERVRKVYGEDKLPVFFHPCNNWNDIMPIADQYGICIEYHNNQFDHCYIMGQEGDAEHWTEGDEAMRAIAITYLKMKESEG